MQISRREIILHPYTENEVCFCVTLFFYTEVVEDDRGQGPFGFFIAFNP